MEILDVAGLTERAQKVGSGARLAAVYPSISGVPGLFAVDLLLVEAGGTTDTMRHPEERVLYVVSGTGTVRGGGAEVMLSEGSAVYIGPAEAHTISNSGNDELRVLVAASLLVRSNRATGGNSVLEGDPAGVPAGSEQPRQLREAPAARPVSVAPASQEAADQGDSTPPPDISGMMKRGSEVAAAQRSDRKRSEPQPEPETNEAVADVEEEDEGEDHPELMELSVVFDGGSRGNPGQGYGSYLVQSPGRKPVIKRVEFGDNYTNNQAEYDTLIACLQYIIERLTATNRTPGQVALDIKSDSDLLVNQLQGNYKVKDAGLRQRHTKALELLEEFGAWLMTWHPREESVRLLGH
jgi:ribonuclease HI/uncharacterized RmlC-like cupin family protein